MNKREYNIDQILNDLQYLSQKEVGKKFGLSQSTICKLQKKYGLHLSKSRLSSMKKQIVDETYFSIIDSPKKAYWLGYLAADGTITHKQNKVSLTSRDLEIVQKFKQDICASYKISTVSSFDKRTKKTYIRYLIQISNCTFVYHLCKLGLDNNKSNVFNFPKIDEKYYSYFIAGLFDGDGSIFIRKNGSLGSDLISTKEVLSFIQSYFYEKFNIKPKSLYPISSKFINVYKVYWSYKDSIKILRFIYQGDPDLYLSRKYNLYSLYKKS